MKKVAALLLAITLLLSGCSNAQKYIDRAVALRSKLLTGNGCSFVAEITADYGDKLHVFSLKCQSDSRGDVAFTVEAPESIAGITGTISQKSGKLTFEDAALSFPLLADDQVTPVSAPWILLKTLLGGYITSAGQEGELLRLTIDDSYEEEALQVDVWLDGENRPVQADICYDGRRILSLSIKEFAFL